MPDTDIKSFQSRLFANYKKDLNLPNPYNFFYGNPIGVVVPLDTEQNNVFILGAYPSAKFATIKSIRDVPVGDNCGPFSSEKYYDGSSCRSVKSGEELEEAYLSPLGISRSQCWITDIVRVFLFKEGHVAKYKSLKCPFLVKENRTKFEEYAKAGIGWLFEELEIATPKVIITLGAEVAGIIRNVNGVKERTALLSGKAKETTINKKSYRVIHLAHPGIVMRPETSKNRWPAIHRNEHIPVAKQELIRLGCLTSRSS